MAAIYICLLPCAPFLPFILFLIILIIIINLQIFIYFSKLKGIGIGISGCCEGGHDVNNESNLLLIRKVVRTLFWERNVC